MRGRIYQTTYLIAKWHRSRLTSGRSDGTDEDWRNGHGETSEGSDEGKDASVVDLFDGQDALEIRLSRKKSHERYSWYKGNSSRNRTRSAPSKNFFSLILLIFGEEVPLGERITHTKFFCSRTHILVFTGVQSFQNLAKFWGMRIL